jgi:hypothetical protein
LQFIQVTAVTRKRGIVQDFSASLLGFGGHSIARRLLPVPPYRPDRAQETGRAYSELSGKGSTLVVCATHDFIRRRTAATRRRKAAYETDEGRSKLRRPNTKGHTVSQNPQVEEDEIKRRIAELKLRRTTPQAREKEFEYDPNEPLRIPEKLQS